MRSRVFGTALVALACFLLGPPDGEATAQDEGATIRGIVFEDIDGNGLRDPDEPGIPYARIELRQADLTLQTSESAPLYGTFAFEQVEAGQYTVAVEIVLGVHLCSLGAFSFNPFPGAYCVGISVPLHPTTPALVTVTVEAGQDLNVDFGSKRAEVGIFAGVALLETDFAPPRTIVEAFVNGQECGSAAVPALPPGSYIGDHPFQLSVLGRSERPGCAAPGDEITFRVGGVPAAERKSFTPTSAASRPGFTLLYLVAMQQHAWYWFEQSGEDLPADGTLVQAVIDGVVCGEARVERPERVGPYAGFSKLIVPSDELQSRCGRDGVTVTFVVDGVATGEPIAWRPGLQEISAFLSGGPILLPNTGSGPSGDDNIGWLAIFVSVTAAGLVVSGAAVLAARRR